MARFTCDGYILMWRIKTWTLAGYRLKTFIYKNCYALQLFLLSTRYQRYADRVKPCHSSAYSSITVLVKVLCLHRSTTPESHPVSCCCFLKTCSFSFSRAQACLVKVKPFLISYTLKFKESLKRAAYSLQKGRRGCYTKQNYTEVKKNY